MRGAFPRSFATQGRFARPCFYGDDHGLIRERADTLTRAIADSLDDPFRVVALDRDAWGTLADEAGSLSMTGGRRVVRVRDATDVLAKTVAAMLAGPSAAFVIVEAPDLATKAKLRAAFEAAPDAAAIACYPEDDRALAETIRESLGADGIRVEPDAMAWLVGHLGHDRAATRSELGKLALYAGKGAAVGIGDVEQIVADAAGLSLDDALMAAATGAVADADRALELALAEGASAVSILRAGLGLFARLHRARLAHDGGQSVDDAVRGLRPPVFFRDAPRVSAAVRLWPAEAIAATLGALTEAERACKQTGAPDLLLVRHAVLTIARRARARSGAR